MSKFVCNSLCVLHFAVLITTWVDSGSPFTLILVRAQIETDYLSVTRNKMLLKCDLEINIQLKKTEKKI